MTEVTKGFVDWDCESGVALGLCQRRGNNRGEDCDRDGRYQKPNRESR